MTITTEQALEIAQQAGLDTFYKTADESARMTVGTHENFTHALNLAAAMALENLYKHWGNSEDIAVMKREVYKYRQAGEAK